MSQVSKYPISKNVSDRIFEIFLETFVKIKSKNEADQFITDLLSPTEKIVLAKRLAIAFLLEKGHDYRAIQHILHVSAPTIASVNNARTYGSEGYKNLITKILKEESLNNALGSIAERLLAAPAALEKGKGTWSYLKQKMREGKRKNRKAF